jgi:inhibitor of cysteine peptidase
MIEIDESFDGRQIDVPAGEVLLIDLKENPTTGYTWHLTGNLEPHLVLEETTFLPADVNKPGQPGIHRWQLKARESGTAKLDFEYKRSWENSSERKLTFTVVVT